MSPIFFKQPINQLMMIIKGLIPMPGLVFSLRPFKTFDLEVIKTYGLRCRIYLFFFLTFLSQQILRKLNNFLKVCLIEMFNILPRVLLTELRI